MSVDSVDLQVDLGGIKLANPVVMASGTFGYGFDYEGLIDPEMVGAVCVKGTTLLPRAGNKPPRIAETPCGMLNSIGLENPGIDVFVRERLPRLRERGATVIANIAGDTIDEYAQIAAVLDAAPGVAGIELNVSCPNVARGGMHFGADPASVGKVIRAVKQATSLPVIPKLSPNVTDIVAIAKTAEDAGADAISMINTLLGMAIDIEARRPALGNVFGGLSGPAIKPIALRMVYQVAHTQCRRRIDRDRHVRRPRAGHGCDRRDTGLPGPAQPEQRKSDSGRGDSVAPAPVVDRRSRPSAGIQPHWAEPAQSQDERSATDAGERPNHSGPRCRRRKRGYVARAAARSACRRLQSGHAAFQQHRP